MANVGGDFSLVFWARPLATINVDVQSPLGTTGVEGQKYAFSPDYNEAYPGVGVSIGTNCVSVYEHGGYYLPPLLVWPGSLIEWTFIAVVYTANRPVLYINGVLAKQGELSIGVPQLYMTSIAAFNYGNYVGDLDEIRVYNRSLTPSAIFELYSTDLLNSTFV